MTGRHRLVIGAELDAFDEDTGALETFELRTPTVAHTVPGYGSLRKPSPSRRVAAVPAPEADHRAPRRRDRVVIAARIGFALLILGMFAAGFAMFRARTADDLMHAAWATSGCWALIGALVGWGIGRG